MSQFIFISRLRQCLAGLPEEEIDRAVEYYEDYFADAKESEEEIIKRLGSPEEIAENIRNEILRKQEKLQEEQGVFTERGFETKEDREHYQEIDKFTQIVKNTDQNYKEDVENKTSGYYQTENNQFQDYYQKENFKKERKEDYYDDKKERKKNRRFIAILVAVFGTVWMCILLCIIAVYTIFFSGNNHDINHKTNSSTIETVAEEKTSSSFTGTPDIVPDQNIKGLDIEISTGNVTIETGDQFSAHIIKNPKNAKLKSSVEKGIWKIEEKSKSKKGIKKLEELMDMTKNSGMEIVITVPESFDAEKIKMEIAAGTLLMVTDGLTTKKADIEVAAGNVEISDITVVDEANIEVGMGSVIVELGNINKLDMECDMGDISYQGILSGKSQIECNMGSVMLDLENSMSDYTFEWETGMGTVEINGDSHGGLSSSGTQGYGNTKIKLEANMGSITVNTGNGSSREKELSEGSNSMTVQEDTYETYSEAIEDNIAQSEE